MTEPELESSDALAGTSEVERRVRSLTLVLERRSPTELRRIVRDALASLHEALGFPLRDSLSERMRHQISVEHFATLALAAAASRDWRASSLHLLNALSSERQLLGELGPLRAALARELMVAA